MRGLNIPSPRILDVGFAEHDMEYVRQKTWFHRKLRESFSDVTGFDIDGDLVDQIRAETSYDKLYCDDITNPKLDYGKFNIVHLGDVIEHVDERASMMSGLRNVLEPNGYLLVSTPNPQSYSFLLDVLQQRVAIPNSDHTAWLCPATMWELCIRNKLKIVKAVGMLTSKRAALSKLMPFRGSASFFSGTYLYLIRLA